MRWGWLLPDSSDQVLFEGWQRQSYRPRHGRPPFVVRGAYSAAMVFSRARERYLGVVDEEPAAGQAAGSAATIGARATAGSRVVAGAGPGSLAGTRASPGVGAAASVGAAGTRRPRSADLAPRAAR